MEKLSYNPQSVESIVNHAKLLLNKSLRGLYPDADDSAGGKGGLGQAVERLHFGYSPNSESRPDFVDACMELKCSPLKQLTDGSVVAKERLVLNVINYMDEAGKDFRGSSFWTKNQRLLLMFYLHQKGISNLDLVFKLIDDWVIPPEDMKIFVDDWHKIHAKIVSGQAHELSEGDTLYLAACTKGSRGGQNKRQQPGTDILADQRAYSIKRSYMDSVVMSMLLNPATQTDLFISEKQRRKIAERMAECGKAVSNVGDYMEGESFEQLIERRFSPYYGKTIGDIEGLLGVNLNSRSKSMAYDICRAILGVKAKRIEEFEKAGIVMKTVRLEAGRDFVKESMSFPAFRYTEVVTQEWEESDWYETLNSRFLFTVFRKSPDGDDKNTQFVKVFFWTMPNEDILVAEALWNDTKGKIATGRYDEFVTSKSNPICHVRPHAADNNDVLPTPQGFYLPKKSFWLNNDYILDIVLKNMGDV